MKTIFALALFGAAILVAQAEEFSEELAEVFDEGDGGNRPKPTHPALCRCLAGLKKCKELDGPAKIKCVAAVKKCLMDNKPQGTPPPFVIIKLRKCVAECKRRGGKLERCAKICKLRLLVKACHVAEKVIDFLAEASEEGRPRPSSPPALCKCLEKGKDCKEEAGDDKDKLKECASAVKKCLMDNKPQGTPPPFVVLQVKKCVVECKRRGGQLDRCAKMCKFRFVVRACHVAEKVIDFLAEASDEEEDERRPTPPKFVCKCLGGAMKCKLGGNSKPECRAAFVKCLNDNKPEGSTRPPSARPPFFKVCLLKCKKNGGSDCKKCLVPVIKACKDAYGGSD